LAWDGFCERVRGCSMVGPRVVCAALLACFSCRCAARNPTESGSASDLPGRRKPCCTLVCPSSHVCVRAAPIPTIASPRCERTATLEKETR
jgi:hypothetical protein